MSSQVNQTNFDLSPKGLFPDKEAAEQDEKCLLLKRAGYGSVFTHISGLKDEKVVSTGSVLSTENGAYIYNIATLEEERGKGYAQTVTHALLEIAKQDGQTRAALISSPMAVNVYQNLGFEKICNFHFYA